MDETPAAPRSSEMLTASRSVWAHRRSRIWTVTDLHRRIAAVLVSRRHAAHGAGVDRWRWSGTIRSTGGAGIVLATTPAQANSRIANGIALHLVDGHLGSMSLDELDEAAAFAWWDLDVGDLSESLKERAQLILGNIARQTSDEDSGVVRISELVHRLGLLLLLLAAIEWLHWWLTHGWIAHRTSTTRHPSHVHASHWTSLVLRGRS